MHTTPASANNPEPEPGGEPTLSATNRRDFLKRGVRALGASVMTIVIYDAAESAQDDAASRPAAELGDSPLKDYDWTRHDYVYLIDTRKCIGCGACVRACSNENDVPPHYFRTWVERYHISRAGGKPLVDSPNGGMDGFDRMVTGEDITKAFFVPKLCCHCTYTPCVQLCPVGASYRTLDGIVLVDDKHCIGCGYCVQACPYGSRFKHPVTHVASKCTLCYHRLVKGETTACVQACPAGARMLGDKKQVGDKVAELIATQATHVLQPQLLTEPNCFYLGLTGEVR